MSTLSNQYCANTELEEAIVFAGAGVEPEIIVQKVQIELVSKAPHES